MAPQPPPAGNPRPGNAPDDPPPVFPSPYRRLLPRSPDVEAHFQSLAQRTNGQAYETQYPISPSAPAYNPFQQLPTHNVHPLQPYRNTRQLLYSNIASQVSTHDTPRLQSAHNTPQPVSPDSSTWAGPLGAPCPHVQHRSPFQTQFHLPNSGTNIYPLGSTTPGLTSIPHMTIGTPEHPFALNTPSGPYFLPPLRGSTLGDYLPIQYPSAPFCPVHSGPFLPDVAPGESASSPHPPTLRPDSSHNPLHNVPLPPEPMPMPQPPPRATRRRRPAASAFASTPSSAIKRRRLLPKPVPDFEKEMEEDGLDVIDLAHANDPPEVYTTVPPATGDGKTRLGSFQCVICMDDAKDLMVTHCGHLYCKECLMASLSMDGQQKCPVCRAKIDNRDRKAYTCKTKGYWPLELKLMRRRQLRPRTSPDPPPDEPGPEDPVF